MTDEIQPDLERVHDCRLVGASPPPTCSSRAERCDSNRSRWRAEAEWQGTQDSKLIDQRPDRLAGFNPGAIATGLRCKRTTKDYHVAAICWLPITAAGSQQKKARRSCGRTGMREKTEE